MTDHVRPQRQTRHRKEVSMLLEGTGEFVSAQNVHARLRANGLPIGLTTVYRTLQTLAREGAVDSLRTATGEQVYRRCSATHHHHLMCRSCSRVIEVEGPAMEQWTRAVGAQHGFRDINHSIELVGTCQACDNEG